jgi:hypothetical protein
VDEHKERGLEGIFGICLVAQDAAAHPQHHRSVPAQKRLKRRLLAPGEECVEQLPVGQTGVFLQPCIPAKMTDHTVHLAYGHRLGSRACNRLHRCY